MKQTNKIEKKKLLYDRFHRKMAETMQIASELSAFIFRDERRFIEKHC